MSDGLTTYAPSGAYVEGVGASFRTTRLMWRELCSARELIVRIFLRDFRARYRQSALGVAWALLVPLAALAVFLGMSRAGILTLRTGEGSYALYAILGLSYWQLFSTTVNAGAHSLIAAGHLVSQVNFPKIALVIAASGQAATDFAVRAVLIAALLVYTNATTHWGALALALLATVPLFLLALACALFLSLLGALVRDTLRALTLALTGLLLVTPVLYPIDGDNVLTAFNAYNPLAYLINAPRALVLSGRTDQWGALALVSLLALGAFCVAWRFFYRAQARITERI